MLHLLTTAGSVSSQPGRETFKAPLRPVHQSVYTFSPQRHRSGV